MCVVLHIMGFLCVCRSCRVVAGTRRRSTVLLQTSWPSRAGSTRYDPRSLGGEETLHYTESRSYESALAIQEPQSYCFSLHYLQALNHHPGLVLITSWWFRIINTQVCRTEICLGLFVGNLCLAGGVLVLCLCQALRCTLIEVHTSWRALNDPDSEVKPSSSPLRPGSVFTQVWMSSQWKLTCLVGRRKVQE